MRYVVNLSSNDEMDEVRWYELMWWCCDEFMSWIMVIFDVLGSCDEMIWKCRVGVWVWTGGCSPLADIL